MIWWKIRTAIILFKKGEASINKKWDASHIYRWILIHIFNLSLEVKSNSHSKNGSNVCEKYNYFQIGLRETLAFQYCIYLHLGILKWYRRNRHVLQCESIHISSNSSIFESIMYMCVFLVIFFRFKRLSCLLKLKVCP